MHRLPLTIRPNHSNVCAASCGNIDFGTALCSDCRTALPEELRTTFDHAHREYHQAVEMRDHHHVSLTADQFRAVRRRYRTASALCLAWLRQHHFKRPSIKLTCRIGCKNTLPTRFHLFCGQCMSSLTAPVRDELLATIRQLSPSSLGNRPPIAKLKRRHRRAVAAALAEFAAQSSAITA